jgi:hypothetical protein
MGMVITHVVTHGLFFGAVATGYLFVFMISASPRIWGYSDYPQAVKNKVPPQTRKEKTLGALLGLPWFVFVLGFPVFSTYALKSKLGGEIPYLAALSNFLGLFLLATIGDLVVLDWLVISKMTPRFVIIPGSEEADYKDFSHHFKGHAKGAVIMIFLAVALAAAVSFL